MRAATPRLLRPSVSTYSSETGVSLCEAARGGHERIGAHVGGLGHERLLVRVAVRDELAVSGDDQRVAAVADADAVHHPPHLFEAELADQPARGLVQTLQMEGERRGGQQILVDADRRHHHAVHGQLVRGPESRLAVCRCDLSRSCCPIRRTA